MIDKGCEDCLATDGKTLANLYYIDAYRRNKARQLREDLNKKASSTKAPSSKEAKIKKALENQRLKNKPT